MVGSLVLAPTVDPRLFVAPDGARLSPPDGWVCLPPGDAALTKRVKQAGPSWAILEKRGLSHVGDLRSPSLLRSEPPPGRLGAARRPACEAHAVS